MASAVEPFGVCLLVIGYSVMSVVLEVQNLTKRYGSFTAVDAISFSVGAGEIVGLLGPNGAGKSTTIHMLLGLVEPTSGTVRAFGQDVAGHRSAIARRMNFSSSGAWLPGNLTLRENLYVYSLLYGVKNPREAITRLLRLVRLEKHSGKKSGFLSSGEQSRLSLAKALLNDPEILLLDEPTASLDPESARDVRALIRNQAAARKTGILWTSHNMHEIEAVCDRVLFLSRGKILLAGNPKTIAREHGKENLEELFIQVVREGLNHH